MEQSKAASNEWLVQGRVLYACFRGDITADEALAVNDEMQRWIGLDGVAPVHVIVDLSGVGRIPQNAREVMGRMRVDYPEKSGWTVIISGSPMTRFIAAITAQVLRQKVRVAASLADGCRFLWQADSTLPPASMPLPPAGTGA